MFLFFGAGLTHFVEEYNTIEIPDLPMIIVIPVSLVQQYKDEIRRYTKPNQVDIIPYTGYLMSRGNFWTSAWAASKQPAIRRIVLATTSVSRIVCCICCADVY